MSSHRAKFLRVSLSSGLCRGEEIPSQTRRGFVGGRGLGIKYLFDEISPGVDPFGPDNRLLFLCGVLAGTSGQGFSRWLAMTKSPLTGGIARASAGGDFGAWLRFSGLEFIVVEGKARSPVYLYIEGERAEIHDAQDLWGLNTEETQEKLHQRHGPRSRVACIGPAGEKLVRYASIVSGRRTAARCGVGAVMGAKNLKAVAINAPEGNPCHPQSGIFKSLIRKQIEGLKRHPLTSQLMEGGTASMTLSYYKMGVLPVCNFQGGRLAGMEELSEENFARLMVKKYGCYSCMVKCGKWRKVAEGPYEGATTEGPEYESAWAFGAQVGSTSIGAIIAADCLCDLLGFDTISAGNTIGFAYELFQRGIINSRDTDGLDLNWGNHSALLTLLQRIGQREGFGHLLGEGARRAAATIGKGAERYAMHVKGLEMSAYEPRAVKGQGLSFAVSNIGASHNYARARQELSREIDPYSEESKGKVIALNAIKYAANETGIVCSFCTRGLEADALGQLISSVTGLEEFTEPGYMDRVGERIVTLERCFNVREGFRRNKDDVLPMRFLTETLRDAGPASGQMIRQLDALIDEYYGAMGYSSDGIPTPERLQSLGLVPP